MEYPETRRRWRHQAREPGTDQRSRPHADPAQVGHRSERERHCDGHQRVVDDLGIFRSVPLGTKAPAAPRSVRYGETLIGMRGSHPMPALPGSGRLYGPGSSCQFHVRSATRPDSGVATDSFENFNASQQRLCLAPSVLQCGVEMGHARDRVLDRVDSDLLGLLVLLQLGLATFPMLVLERPVKDGKDGYHDSQEKQRDEYEPIDTCHGYGSNARHLL